MSHHIYTTPGFVVESFPHGEAGKFIYIFTRDLGMVAGVAQGIRLSQSKLRYHAQDFSFSNFSLVRGKEIWRIVGAEKIEDVKKVETDEIVENDEIGKVHKKVVDFTYVKEKDRLSGETSPLFVRVLKILKRLVPGEEKNEALFETVHAAFLFLQHVSKNEKAPVDETNAEYIIMLRILHQLGYIRTVPALEPFLADNSFNPELLAAMTAAKAAALKEINTALKESQL